MLPKSIQNLATLLSQWPEIGPRAALRLSFYLLSQNQTSQKQLIDAILDLKNTKVCPQCFNLSEETLCKICKQTKRNKHQILVVETILDILPIERTKQFAGLYHVLGGALSPLDGLTPDKLKIKELINRLNILKKENQTAPIEVIFAFNPTNEGDATALYLDRILKPHGIKTSRLGRGLSAGSSLEYADENTIAEAIKSRK